MSRTARSKLVEGSEPAAASGGDRPVVADSPSPSQFLRKHLPLGKASDPEGVLAVLREMLHVWGEPRSHRRYFGTSTSMSTVACALSDAMLSLAKPELGAAYTGSFGGELEQYVLGYLGECLGLGALPSAHFVSDAAQANEIALRAALCYRFPSAVTSGSGSIVRPRLYLSEGADSGFELAALASGLGSAAVQRIPTDAQQRLRPDLLTQQIAADAALGMKPFLIVATAGTWAAGAIDPLERVGQIARANGLWLHVDATWGGVLGWSERERAGLEGIEWADSVAGEAHRWLAAPLAAGLLFCRHRESLRKVSSLGADPEALELRSRGPSRHVPALAGELLGLKTLLFLMQHGKEALGARIERQCLMKELLRQRLMAAGFALIGQPRLPVVCFTHTRLRQDLRRHQQMVDELNRRRIAYITCVSLANGMPALRACIAHDETDSEDIDALIGGLSGVIAGLDDSTGSLH